jgi:hypothetical protein
MVFSGVTVVASVSVVADVSVVAGVAIPCAPVLAGVSAFATRINHKLYASNVLIIGNGEAWLSRVRRSSARVRRGSVGSASH